MSRIALQPGFILHRYPYRETSLLLEVFCCDYGRVGLLARAARSGKSQSKALLQAFTPLLLSWSGKGELFTLTAAEATGPGFQIPPRRLYSALYINELLLRLLARGDTHLDLFQAYQQALAALSISHNEEVPLRIFEKHLLSELGYGLLLNKEADTGQPLDAAKTYRYVLESGPLTASSTNAGILISGQSLLALHSESIADETTDSRVILAELKRLMRSAISLQLDGKPLKTRQIMLEQQRRNKQRLQ